MSVRLKRKLYKLALADIQTVPVDQALQMAKPFKKQQVNKGRIWLLFVLGASSLFGITVLAENNGDWFPAISRANKAMRVSKKKRQEQLQQPESNREEEEEFPAPNADLESVDPEEAARLAAVQAEREADARAEAAVLEGLRSARQRAGVDSDVGGEQEVEAESDDSEESEGEESGAEDERSSGADTWSREEVGTIDFASTTTRRPLMEISTEQIEASVRQRKAASALAELSEEDLRQELARRSGGGQVD